MNISVGNLCVSLLGASSEMKDILQQLFFWKVDDGNANPRWLISISTDAPAFNLKSIGDDAMEFSEPMQILSNDPRIIRLQSGGVVSVYCSENLIRIDNPSFSGLVNDTYRVLRQILMCEAAELGYGCLHGSGVVGKDGVTIFVGDKGAGKSTMSGHLASSLGLGFLANDKVLVSPALEAVHFPEAPAITIETLLCYDDLVGRWDRLLESDFSPGQYFVDHPALPDPSTLLAKNLTDKLIFSEQEYLRFLGVVGIRHGPIKQVCVLDTQRHSADSWENIDPDILHQHVDPLETYPDWLGLRPNHDWSLPSIDVDVAFYHPPVGIEQAVEGLSRRIG